MADKIRVSVTPGSSPQLIDVFHCAEHKNPLESLSLLWQMMIRFLVL